jgi:pyruvate dehydrogenase E2 component (dihydrolipoamide acetyltransferase)
VSTEVKLPRLGQGMESGTIVKWLKSEGDRVERGDPLYELDTEKVTQEVEAEASGLLLRIDVPEGEVEVGRTIALIGDEGEELPPRDAPEPREEARPEPEPPAAARPEPDPPAAASQDPVPGPVPGTETRPEEPEGGRIKASPLARRIARERGIDLASVRGTGPDGRIVAEDVERREAAAPAAAATVPAAGAVERVQLDSLRRTIARRMTEAWQAPAFQIAMSADMTRASALRERLVDSTREGEPRPTISDVLTRVCAAALLRHRAVNARFAGDAVELYGSADIGIAVAVPGGLVVPIVRGAERLTIRELATVRADLVARARAGKLTMADLEGGTFTISNLGMYGVERFVAVLNPPQAAILAVGAIGEKAVVRDGALVAAPMLELTLSCDHRAVDGATAAEFLRTVKELLENPELML